VRSIDRVSRSWWGSCSVREVICSGEVGGSRLPIFGAVWIHMLGCILFYVRVFVVVVVLVFVVVVVVVVGVMS